MLELSEQNQRTEDCDRLHSLSRRTGEDAGRRRGPAPVVRGRCSPDGEFLLHPHLHPNPPNSKTSQSAMAGYQALSEARSSW